MKRLLTALSLPLVACYAGERRESGECPAGETCSDLTPRGLDFVGNKLVGDILLSGPRATAVGGTQAVALEYDRGDGIDVALDMPFTADDDGGIGVRVEGTSGSQVTLRGAGSRTNYLRILDSDGLLMDRKELTGAALDTIKLVSIDFENIPADKELAFATGEREIGIALYGQVQGSNGPRSERIVDTSMDLALAGSQRTGWDMLKVTTAAVGTYPITVTAGDKPAAALDFVVVGQADSVGALQPTPSTIMPNQTQSICFQASAGTRYIVGLTWTYNVDGQATVKGEGSLSRNCISVSTQKTTGTVSIQASAGGQTTALALAVGATPREVETVAPTPIRPLMPTSITTAGDRASM